jgi:hypothetical protein
MVRLIAATLEAIYIVGLSILIVQSGVGPWVGFGILLLFLIIPPTVLALLLKAEVNAKTTD